MESLPRVAFERHFWVSVRKHLRSTQYHPLVAYQIARRVIYKITPWVACNSTPCVAYEITPTAYENRPWVAYEFTPRVAYENITRVSYSIPHPTAKGMHQTRWVSIQKHPLGSTRETPR